MASLRIEAFIIGPKGRFVTAEHLRERSDAMPTELDLLSHPSGGVTVTDDVEMIVIDDSLIDAASFFFTDLPGLLRAGESSSYRFRTGPGSVSIDVSGATATVKYDRKEIEAPVDALLAALETGRQDYEYLLNRT